MQSNGIAYNVSPEELKAENMEYRRRKCNTKKFAYVVGFKHILLFYCTYPLNQSLSLSFMYSIIFHCVTISVSIKATA